MLATPYYLDGEKDLEARIEGYGARETKVAKTKHPEAFVTGPFLPLRVREGEIGTLGDNHLRSRTFGQDGKIRIKMTQLRNLFVRRHVDIPDHNAHTLTSRCYRDDSQKVYPS